MASKNVFNGSVGVVADTANVKSVVVGHGATVDVDADRRQLLVVHLSNLRQRLASAPSEVDRTADEGLIELAKSQASAGDERGAWATLKKVSSWTLGVARDIGVDIAAAVLRQQTGLP